MKSLLCIVLLVFCFSVRAQDLEQLGKKDMVKVGGGVGWNMSANMVDDQKQTRDPFTWVATGNLNFTVLGVSLPFTYSITNRNSSYTQPFNMTALHPSYKWFKSHIGITSMSFSPYTYGGLNFAGAGVEMTPKKWRIKAFGGRLKKAVEYDAVANNVNTVSYKRMGGALSVGYENKGYGATLIILKASDNPTSLQYTSPNLQLYPMDNLVTSVQAKAPFLKFFDLQVEYANSLLTRNVLLTGNDNYNANFFERTTRGNSSTVSKNAYNGALNFRAKWCSVALKYERVDPDYMTLGALFFNNDLENYTIAPMFNLLNGKLTINANTGFQRNNLSKDKATQLKRWVGNISVSGQPFKNFTTSVNYSNFSTFSRRNPAADPYYNPLFDTMNVYQLSQSFTAMASYGFGTENKKTVTGNYVFSQSQNITGSLPDAAAFGFNVSGMDEPANVHTAMAAFNVQFKQLEMGLSTTVNYNQTEVMDIRSEYIGPGINLQKKLWKKKLATNLGAIYNQQYTNGSLASHVMNWRIGANMSPELWDKKYGKINLALNANYAHRFAIVNGALAPKNLTIVFNLNYSF